MAELVNHYRLEPLLVAGGEVVGVEDAPLFATGMVNGYFSNDVPIPFWELLALYISSNTLSSVPWAIPFGQSQIQVMINQAKDVLSWYENMTKSIPTWYKGVIPK